MGPRLGRFKGSSPHAIGAAAGGGGGGGVAPAASIKSHNIPLIAVGFFVLVFGFLAFNGGSQVKKKKYLIENPL